MLRCKDGTLYTGKTNNLAKRVQAHESGKGAKYTRGRGPFRVVYQECGLTNSQASKREAEIKKLRREEKQFLICHNCPECGLPTKLWSIR